MPESEGKEGYGDAARGPFHCILVGRPAIGKGGLDTCLDFAGLHIGKVELSKGFKVGDDVSDARTLGSDIEAVWEGDGVGAVEVVDGERTEGVAEEGANVNGDIDGLHTVDIKDEIGVDICIGILETNQPALNLSNSYQN